MSHFHNIIGKVIGQTWILQDALDWEDYIGKGKPLVIEIYSQGILDIISRLLFSYSNL